MERTERPQLVSAPVTQFCVGGWGEGKGALQWTFTRLVAIIDAGLLRDAQRPALLVAHTKQHTKSCESTKTDRSLRWCLIIVTLTLLAFKLGAVNSRL